MVEVAMLNGRVQNALVILIALAWAASILGQIFNPSYEPDASINGAFGLVVGAVLAVGKRDGGSGKDEDGRR